MKRDAKRASGSKRLRGRKESKHGGSFGHIRMKEIDVSAKRLWKLEKWRVTVSSWQRGRKALNRWAHSAPKCAETRVVSCPFEERALEAPSAS